MLRLNAGIFVLHIVLYAMFVVLPPLIVAGGLELPQHWKLYLPVVLASFVLMIPAVVHADRRDRPKPVLLGSVALLMVVEAALAVLDAGLGAVAASASLMGSGAEAEEILERAGVDPKARAEEIDLEGFLAIVRTRGTWKEN